MIKTIRFLGKLILILAETIKVISTVLRFIVFMLICMGILMGFLISIMDIISPDIQYVKLWLDIVLLIICGGTLWVGYDKLLKQERDLNKKMDSLRNYDNN